MPSFAELDAMRYAIALSARGLGTTSPNPPVGCVVLNRDGEVVGTGYHARKGEPHAEPQALEAAGERARGGTAAVTLEPCNHVGLTPACRQALLDAGVTRVLIAVLDPTSRGEGGAAVLRSAGVEVEVGVLDYEAHHVLGPWLTATLQRRPFVTWAYALHAPNIVDPDMIDDLRQEADVVLHRDGRLEEGIPGAHGAGMLQIPTALESSGDLVSRMQALYRGGARTILIAGDTQLARRLHHAGLVDRTVMGVDRWNSTAQTSPAPGYQVEAVATIGGSIRITAGRAEGATAAGIDMGKS
jgi:diaminohydroxyphosphoribosylaminopyrimidine deaminase/5-amino-6-(5-phosphoribosylamino)uracil reductase